MVRPRVRRRPGEPVTLERRVSEFLGIVCKNSKVRPKTGRLSYALDCKFQTVPLFCKDAGPNKVADLFFLDRESLAIVPRDYLQFTKSSEDIIFPSWICPGAWPDRKTLAQLPIETREVNRVEQRQEFLLGHHSTQLGHLSNSRDTGPVDFVALLATPIPPL